MEQWRDAFIKKKFGAWKAQCLYRSLRVAYQASTVPFGNYEGGIHDYGTRLALWVSALEILTHPRKGNANLTTVLDLLERAAFVDKRLASKRYRVRFRQSGNWVSRPVTFAQKLYQQVYRARNDFLHGNRVPASRLFAFGAFANKGGFLPSVMPLVYRHALYAYMLDPTQPWDNDFEFTQKLDAKRFEEALAKAMRKKKLQPPVSSP